jgi:ribosomal protein S18 acetylase RimI-like enzyme
MNTNTVCLESSQIDRATEILTDAFHSDPLFDYFFPEFEGAKRNSCRFLMKMLLNYSQPYNHIYTTVGELKGIAAWLPPNQYPLNNFKMLRLGLYILPFKVRFSRLKKFFSIFDTLDRLHKEDVPEPHWYLLVLGVAAKYQSLGIGSLLLQPVLELADREGFSCYLETSTEKAVRFYQKHGFEVIRTGTSLEFWTMKRKPC